MRGRGLLLALQFESDLAYTVLVDCLEKGLLVNKPKPNVIRLMPPLIITNKDVDRAVSIFDKVFSGIKK